MMSFENGSSLTPLPTSRFSAAGFSASYFAIMSTFASAHAASRIAW